MPQAIREKLARLREELAAQAKQAEAARRLNYWRSVIG